jgi:hypothetical protein
VCRPSTNLLALYHAAHYAQQWVTLELGLKTPATLNLHTKHRNFNKNKNKINKCKTNLPSKTSGNLFGFGWNWIELFQEYEGNLVFHFTFIYCLFLYFSIKHT